LPDTARGAQRASSVRRLRSLTFAIAATLLALGGLASTAHPAAAAGIKVVIVVGPTHSATANYIDNARRYAAQARSYGATVYELYSPNATWDRVRSVAQGANILMYLGHGNGWPSPYAPFSAYTKDGMGLNASAGNGNANVKYYGEYYVSRGIRLAANAVVILNRLCYASGNSEPGMTNPTKATAIKRVDNYAAGFLRANARAVFAEGIGSASFILYSLFKTTRTIKQTFWADPTRSGASDFTFSSVRTPGKSAIMDPVSGKYYRSVVGDLGMTSTAWRTGG
jgi:hypothetical protein